jgi:hypothetical protein
MKTFFVKFLCTHAFSPGNFLTVVKKNEIVELDEFELFCIIRILQKENHLNFIEVYGIHKIDIANLKIKR